MINYLFAVALLIMQQLAAVDATAQKGMLPAFWKPLCGLSEELDSKPHKAISDLQSATSQVELMQRATLRAQIYGLAMAGTKEATPTALAELYYSSKVQASLSKLRTTSIQAAIETASAATYLKGHVDEYLSLWSNVNQGGSDGCLLTNAGSAAATITQNRLGGTECKLKLTGASSSGIQPTHITANGFPQLAHRISGDDEQHSSGKCTLASGHTNNGLGDGSALAANFKVLDGYLTIPNSANALSINSVQTMTQEHANTHPAWYNAWSKNKLPPQAEDPAFTNTTGEIKNYNLVSEAIRTVNLKKAEAADADVEAQVTSYFGGKDDAKWKEFIAKIEKFPIPAKTGKQAEPTTLGAIEDTETLLTILYHYQLQLSKRLTELQTRLDDTESKGKNKTPEQLCNEIKDAKTCNADKKCKYDETKKEEPKCTLSEEGKQKAAEKANQETEGKDEKPGTTNTTASNSFVINKAPLLLAFLLF
ncbi:variant surface glycoprotein (VSG), putative [Trypanosoma brucei brucei TREU927]|uniref:Variant surface glycoprotein (VSG), putative n=1 Tax=Trypanosoma brucei brucei (strain 927/4 GUTat10.1) TaxID=185431 RepID=Q387N7_TRYB2|nr:variant surface glycoprotein [Trypanosoma brucei brucei TREU927]EAN78994.1 variant surface glycoprotein (VSG), putative [Trypanosoma brucei brucei TREU927]